MGYHNGSQTQYFSQPTHSIFTFGTVLATISLMNDASAPISGGVVDQGGGSWIPVGTTDVGGNATFEVFAGSYKFKMSYHGASQEITQDVSTPVVFQTGSVFSSSGFATQYAQGSWQPFAQFVQLLPGYWHFKFSDGTPIMYYTISAGTVNYIY